MIFSPSPSSIVRAEAFRWILLSHDFDVDYYYDFSSKREKLIKKTSKIKIFIFFNLLLRLLNKIISKYKRNSIIREIKRYDAIIVIKYPGYAFMQMIKQNATGKILYDIDDAVWLPSFFGKEVFCKLVEIADYISCDNSYLMNFTRKYNPNVFVLNGPSQLELFEKRSPSPPNNDIINIGWIGSQHTLFYLYSIYNVLEKIGQKYDNVVFTIIGTGTDKSKIPEFEKIKTRVIETYDQQSMVEYVSRFDIGIYPLFENELSLGRGSLKATIYMSAKVPAICAAVGGENEEIIEHGKNGFLAHNENDWFSLLELLINNEKLRREVGQNGYEFVRENYSLEACYTQLYSNFLSKI